MGACAGAWRHGQHEKTERNDPPLPSRLCTLRPTEAQVRTLLAHPDSPYIRAIGFLCLRYTANPRTLWGWCDRFVADAEEFSPSPSGVGRPVSMGAYVRDLLLTHAYFETLFPRVPKPVADEIAAKLSARGLPPRAAGNAGQGGADRRGDAGAARPASVKASLSVAFGQRAPNRAGGREEGRGAWARADGSRDRRDDRGGWRDDRGRDHGYGDRGGYGGDRDRGRDRPRSRSPPRYRARSRSRSPPPPRR